MERQLKFFFDFLENDKKLSDNTLQSYKRDLKQFKRYLEACEISYNHVKEDDVKDYIKSKWILLQTYNHLKLKKEYQVY